MSIVKHKKLNGFSLIELLITVIIVNFGALGLVKLQLLNYDRINNSILSLKAAQLSATFVDKLISNLSVAKSSNSPYILTEYTDSASNQAQTRICISSKCNATVLADYDMNTWLYKIKNNLPKGKAKVVKEDDGSSTIFTISIQWQYKSETKSYELVAEL